MSKKLRTSMNIAWSEHKKTKDLGMKENELPLDVFYLIQVFLDKENHLELNLSSPSCLP